MEDSGELRRMPLHVDEPVPIIFWSAQEFILIMSILGVSITFNVWGVGFVGAGFAVWGLRKLKRGAKRGAAQHWIWRRGLNMDKALAKTAPQPLTPEFIE